jgi:hypothetical protein
MEREKLFIDINGPYLSMDKRIHTRQVTDHGIQFGATRNKYGANLIRVEGNKDNYTITFIRYSRPKYNRQTKQFEPYKHVVKYKEEGLTLYELREILNGAFK